MAVCDHCGAHVSDRFARVFEADGKLRACPHCASSAGIAEVAMDRAGRS